MIVAASGGVWAPFALVFLGVLLAVKDPATQELHPLVDTYPIAFLISAWVNLSLLVFIFIISAISPNPIH